MTHEPGVHLDGVPLHMVQRGHNREPCFFAEQDYPSYLHGWATRWAKRNAGCMPTAS